MRSELRAGRNPNGFIRRRGFDRVALCPDEFARPRRSIMLDVTKRQDTAPFDTALLDRLHGRSGDRCPGRDVEAQRAVPARRSPRLLLRIHGRHGAEPLPAGFRLPERRAAKSRLLRPSHGGFSERGKTVLGVGSQYQELGRRRRDGKSRRLSAPPGAECKTHRDRDRVHPARFGCRIAQGFSECRNRRCTVRSRTSPRA